MRVGGTTKCTFIATVLGVHLILQFFIYLGMLTEAAMHYEYEAQCPAFMARKNERTTNIVFEIMATAAAWIKQQQMKIREIFAASTAITFLRANRWATKRITSILLLHSFDHILLSPALLSKWRKCNFFSSNEKSLFNISLGEISIH